MSLFTQVSTRPARMLVLALCEGVVLFRIIIQARQISIHSLAPFYESELFKQHKFIYDRKRKRIIQQL